MKEGPGVVGPALFPPKRIKNEPKLFEPPLNPYLSGYLKIKIKPRKKPEFLHFLLHKKHSGLSV